MTSSALADIHLLSAYYVKEHLQNAWPIQGQVVYVPWKLFYIEGIYTIGLTLLAWTTALTEKKHVMFISVKKSSQKCEWAPYDPYLYYLILDVIIRFTSSHVQMLNLHLEGLLVLL